MLESTTHLKLSDSDSPIRSESFLLVIHSSLPLELAYDFPYSFAWNESYRTLQIE
jgi:hypothetical protein